MGKTRCENCGAKVSDDYEFCPHCGVRMPDAERGNGGGATGCLIVFFVLVIVTAVGGSLWLLEQHKAEESTELRMKYIADSLKAVRIANERAAALEADAKRMIEDSIREVRHMEDNLCKAVDFVRGGVLRDNESIIGSLRQRGYQTIGRDRGAEMTVMGLNAEICGGKVAGHGGVFCVVALWSRRMEIMFSSQAYSDNFLAEMVAEGFDKRSAGRLENLRNERVIERANGAIEIVR